LRGLYFKTKSDMEKIATTSTLYSVSWALTWTGGTITLSETLLTRASLLELLVFTGLCFLAYTFWLVFVRDETRIKEFLKGIVWAMSVSTFGFLLIKLWAFNEMTVYITCVVASIFPFLFLNRLKTLITNKLK